MIIVDRRAAPPSGRPTYDHVTVLLIFNHAKAQILLTFWITFDSTCCFGFLTWTYVYVYTYKHVHKELCWCFCVCTFYLFLSFCAPSMSFQAGFLHQSLWLSSRMKFLLSLAVLVVTLGVLSCAPEDQPKSISEDTLRRELIHICISNGAVSFFIL